MRRGVFILCALFLLHFLFLFFAPLLLRFPFCGFRYRRLSLFPRLYPSPISSSFDLRAVCDYPFSSLLRLLPFCVGLFFLFFSFFGSFPVAASRGFLPGADSWGSVCVWSPVGVWFKTRASSPTPCIFSRPPSRPSASNLFLATLAPPTRSLPLSQGHESVFRVSDD